MVILGIETSTPQSSVCLASDEGLLASAALGRGQAHGEFVAPAIRFCCTQAAVELDALDGVAVSLGPGLFTGMRVGIITAQVIAQLRGLPAVGLASLDLLALRLRHAERLICAVLDARRRELFWAFYRHVPGGVQRTGEFAVGPPDRLAGELEAERETVLCVGDGAQAHSALLEASGAEVVRSAELARPDARSLVELALPRFERGETVAPTELRPLYIRRADARMDWQRRGALHGGKAPQPHGETHQGGGHRAQEPQR